MTTTVITVRAPQFAGTREAARALVAPLPATLARTSVVVDLADTKAAAPSFVDELIRLILVDRGGLALELAGASPRAAELAARFARNHGAADRLRLPGDDPIAYPASL